MKGKERKKKRKRKKKKRRGRKPNQRCAVVGPRQARNGTALREVGVYLPRFYSMTRGRVMAYGVLFGFWTNLYDVCDCGMVRDLVDEFLGPSRSSTTTQNRVNLGITENGGMPEFPHYSYESVAPTSDDHNFLVRTSIRLFLDSTKSS